MTRNLVDYLDALILQRWEALKGVTTPDARAAILETIGELQEERAKALRSVAA